jgi:hypothetical protein
MHIQAEYDLERAREKIGMGMGLIQSRHMNEEPLPMPDTSFVTENADNDQAVKKNIKRRIMR